jgi:hypothetical protein
MLHLKLKVYILQDYMKDVPYGPPFYIAQKHVHLDVILKHGKQVEEVEQNPKNSCCL